MLMKERRSGLYKVGGVGGRVRTGQIPDRLDWFPLDIFWHSTTV
jgi:hypothetical protein